MERREKKTQASGICHRLFSFLIDNLLFRGIKRITVGRAMENESAVAGGRKGMAIPEGSGMHNLAYGMPSRGESLVERASKLNKSFPITSIGSSVHIQKNGNKEVHEDVFETQSPRLRMIPVGGSQDEVASHDMDGEDEYQELVKVGRGKEEIIPKSALKERNMEKKKGKKVTMKEKMTLAAEPGNDVKVRSPTPMIPIISSAFNIDQRSDELIRRTREALRNSAKQLN